MSRFLAPSWGAIALAAASVALGASSAQAATVLNVGASSLCGAGGCFAAGNSFRATYSASGYSGHVDIAALLLDKSLLGVEQNKVFKVGFRLADGTAVGDWGSFMIAGLSGEVVQIGGKAVSWDTSQGDLILTLDLFNPNAGGVGGGGGLSSSVGGGGGGGVGADLVDLAPAIKGNDMAHWQPTAALPTLIGPALLAPEPASWGLMLMGFGAAGVMLRTRRRHFRSAT